jgi:hypothetical protein
MEEAFVASDLPAATAPACLLTDHLTLPEEWQALTWNVKTNEVHMTGHMTRDCILKRCLA